MHSQPLQRPLISGEYLEVESTFEYEEDGVKVTVMPVVLDLTEYLFTIEERGEVMTIQLRSTQIPELMISLPSPVMVKLALLSLWGSCVEAPSRAFDY